MTLYHICIFFPQFLMDIAHVGAICHMLLQRQTGRNRKHLQTLCYETALQYKINFQPKQTFKSRFVKDSRQNRSTAQNICTLNK